MPDWLTAGLKFFTSLFGFATKTEEVIERANDRTAGKNEITAANELKDKEAAEHALQTATDWQSDSADRSLRDGSF